MKLKSKIRAALKKQYGEFKSVLEHQYEDKLTENLLGNNNKRKKEWVTYNQVILELKHSLRNTLKVKELQYKLTENLNPNDACIEVIQDVKDCTPELERLYHKIKNF